MHRLPKLLAPHPPYEDTSHGGFCAQSKFRFCRVTELEGDPARHKVAEYQNPPMSGSEVAGRADG